MLPKIAFWDNKPMVMHPVNLLLDRNDCCSVLSRFRTSVVFNGDGQSWSEYCNEDFISEYFCNGFSLQVSSYHFEPPTSYWKTKLIQRIEELLEFMDWILLVIHIRFQQFQTDWEVITALQQNQRYVGSGCLSAVSSRFLDGSYRGGRSLSSWSRVRQGDP